MQVDLHRLTEAAPLITTLVGAAVALGSVAYQRHQERLAINRAILAETSRLLAVVGRHRDWWETCRECRKVDVPLIDFSTAVYDKLGERVSLIDPAHIAAIVSFYGFVRFLNAVQQTRNHYRGDDRLFEFAPFYSKTLRQVGDFAPFLDSAFAKYGVCPPDRQPVVGSAAS